MIPFLTIAWPIVATLIAFNLVGWLANRVSRDDAPIVLFAGWIGSAILIVTIATAITLNPLT